MELSLLMARSPFLKGYIPHMANSKEKMCAAGGEGYFVWKPLMKKTPAVLGETALLRCRVETVRKEERIELRVSN
jgi:hypothetical protein